MFLIRAPKRIVVAVVLAVGLATIGSTTAGGGTGLRIIKMMDQCDPASFNAALGPDTCVGNKGGVPLDTFLRVLGRTGHFGAWHFAPGQVRLQEGQVFQAVNHGGEVHTFTEVDEFGGGFVEELNQLSGNLEPAPECNLTALGPDDFIPPDGASEPEAEESGTHHYQCCIHPWMRADVIVR
jgi:plastocyanin